MLAWDRRSSKLGATVAIAQTQQHGSAEHATRATIAFRESDRPDGPRAGDAYGDEGVAKALIGGRSQRHAARARAGRESAESREPGPTC